MRSIKWCYFQWPWTNPNPVFRITPLFDAKYLTNGYRCGHSYHRTRIGNRTQAFEWHYSFDDLRSRDQVVGPPNTTGLDLFTRRFIYNDIYSEAHTVDTSKLIGLSNKSCHVDHSGTFSPTRLSTSTAVKRSADPSVDQLACWSADRHVTPESISAPCKVRFAGSEVMVMWRPGYRTQRSVTPG